MLEFSSEGGLCSFKDDVEVVFGFVDIDEVDDVSTLESFHDPDFGDEGVLVVLILLHDVLGDHLDGH